jgi:hypothetical protein
MPAEYREYAQETLLGRRAKEEGKGTEGARFEEGSRKVRERGEGTREGLDEGSNKAELSQGEKLAWQAKLVTR